MSPVSRTFQIARPERYPEFKRISFIKRGVSSTQVTLYYIKMKKSPVTAKQIADFVPNFFRKPSDAARVARTLEKHGFIQKVYDNCWRITPLGKEACYLIGKRDVQKASCFIDF
jgi:hypothetical protein